MKKFLIITMMIVLAAAGWIKFKPRRLPTEESVRAVVTTTIDLEDTISHCIMAGVPIHMSFDELLKELIRASEEGSEAKIPRSEKENAFLDGVKSRGIGRDVEDRAAAYFETPSRKTAKDLISAINFYIQQVMADTEAPLWQELVPDSLTTRALKEIRQLEQQAAQL